MSFEIRERAGNFPLWPIGTLVIWLACYWVGLLGLRIGYPGPRAPEDQQELPPTQIVNVQLTPEPAPPPEPLPPPPQQPVLLSTEPPAPPPAAVNLPEQPAVAAVAPPSPAISFALPTEGLTHIVDASQAGYTRRPLVGTAPAGGNGTGPPGSTPPPSKPAVTTSAPAVERLTFGEGEGRQTPPEYPREAVLAHQEGTVGVRFTVGEDGRVLSAEVISPSRWPLLNQAALRAVHDTWRFSPGARRIYDVPIEFQLNH